MLNPPPVAVTPNTHTIPTPEHQDKPPKQNHLLFDFPSRYNEILDGMIETENYFEDLEDKLIVMEYRRYKPNTHNAVRRLIESRRIPAP